MRRKRVFLKTCVAIGLLAFAAAGSVQAEPLFGFTHMLPSPLTLSGGTLVYGTSVGYGVTDFFQVGTDVVSDVYKVFNANAKLGLIETRSFAVAPTFSFETYNLHDIIDSNPDQRVVSYLPGIVTAYAVAPSLALFVGGNLDYNSPQPVTDGIVKSGFYHGAAIESDLSWGYNGGFDRAPSKSGQAGRQTASSKASGESSHGILSNPYNVLSFGVTYDITYKIFGIGISHHWPGFHLGIHYYPNADRNQILPIIAGGGSVSF